LWDSLSRIAIYTNPAECLSADNYIPSDRELFDLESNVIARIAEQRSAVFLGRCGRYILNAHPRRFSLLVTAAEPDRILRAQELYCIQAEEARKLLRINDRERKAYIRAFTNQDAWDARLYDLCLNLSTVGKEAAAEIALHAVREKLGL
jgi:cytidylate kinase